MKMTLYLYRCILGTMFVLISTLAFSQNRTITGRVTDQDDGSGLPGVNITVKGTTTGTVTDANGDWSFSAPGNATLVFSYIGYVTQEVPVNNRSTINLQLASDVAQLSEIVVTGYTTENRREVTGAVSTVAARELVQVPSGNIEQQLQGRIPGVTVVTNGQPGTTSVVRIRGFGAFGGNEPLYIVDGVPVDDTFFLQPDDIESTTVLKDAASASIYGARAANGVIVYTTKKGRRGDGKMRVSYDGVFGVTVPNRVNTILSPQEEADWTWQAIRNTARQLGTDPEFNHPQFGTGQVPVIPDYIRVGNRAGVVGDLDLAAERERYNIDPRQGAIYQVMAANKSGTNWYDEITRPAPLNRHTLGLSGGTDRSHYYVSLGMQEQAGILLHQQFSRYYFRVNSEHSLTNRIRIGQNIQGTFLQRRGITGGEGGRAAANNETDWLQAFRMPSIIPVYDVFGGYAGTAAQGFNNPRNPVANRDREKDNVNNEFLGFGNIYAEVDVINGLTLRSSIGGRIRNNYGQNYFPVQYENSENRTSFQYQEFAGINYNWVWTNTANYSVKFGVHKLDLLGGVEALQTNIGRSIFGQGLDPFSTDPNYVTLTNTQAAGRQISSNYGLGFAFFSVFGRAQYNYNDKYIITGVLRRDGSSRFGPENRYGVFPAASAAWRISAEDFMSGIGFISDLKIRGGWGEMGNSNNVAPANQFNLFATSLGLSAYDIAGSNSNVQEGFYRSRIGNPAARWETSVTSNVGLDGSFFNDRLSLVLDIWRKDTRDLLFTPSQPATVAPLAANPALNVGDMRNQGIDIEIGTRGNVTPELGFDIRLTGSFLKNEIVRVAPTQPFFDVAGSRIGNLIRNQPGFPISSYFGYQQQGLWQSQQEIDQANELARQRSNGEVEVFQQGAAPGRFRFADTNNDGFINADDRTYLGDPVPDFIGGLNLRLTYRNFELETFVTTFLGVQNYHFGKWFTDFYPSFTGAAKGQNVKESWLPERGGNTVPIYENVSNFSTNTQSNSYYVENGNYLRMTNLQLAYNVPAPVLARLGIERARIFIQGTNLFTISPYTGLDPGVAGAVDTTLGIDFGNPPLTRGYNIGLNLGF